MRDDQPELRCSFCNKEQRFVRKLIAGPNVYICDECVAICVDLVAEDRGESPQRAAPGYAGTPYVVASSCSLCRMPAPLEHMIAVHSRGALCPGCVGAIEAAVAAAQPPIES